MTRRLRDTTLARHPDLFMPRSNHKHPFKKRHQSPFPFHGLFLPVLVEHGNNDNDDNAEPQIVLGDPIPVENLAGMAAGNGPGHPHLVGAVVQLHQLYGGGEPESHNVPGGEENADDVAVDVDENSTVENDMVDGPSGVELAQPSGVELAQPSGVELAQPSGVELAEPSGVELAEPSGVELADDSIASEEVDGEGSIFDEDVATTSAGRGGGSGGGGGGVEWGNDTGSSSGVTLKKRRLSSCNRTEDLPELSREEDVEGGDFGEMGKILSAKQRYIRHMWMFVSFEITAFRFSFYVKFYEMDQRILYRKFFLKTFFKNISKNNSKKSSKKFFKKIFRKSLWKNFQKIFF